MSAEIKKSLVSTDWLLDHLDDENLRIIDITLDRTEQPDGTFEIQSGRSSYMTAHIPGAQFADLLGKLSDKESDLAYTLPSAEDFAHEVSALGINNNNQVVIYTRSYSALATRLWWMFRAFGFEGAAVLDGSFAKWEREGKPICDRPTEPAPANFSAALNPAVVATLDDVQATMAKVDADNGNSCLIDSLSVDYFHGKAGDNYGYGRLGHIPGAINIPTETMLNPETGEFLPAVEIEKIFKQSLGDLNGRYIAYCGGGIAASQNVFALHLIGKKDVALYDGSLQEWVKDAARPLSTD